MKILKASLFSLFMAFLLIISSKIMPMVLKGQFSAVFSSGLAGK